MSNTMSLPSPNTKSDLRALNAFVTQNSDLERLESILAQFNLFEAIGVIRQELRHSDLLAFLLNPSRNHGIADAFLKKLLQEVSPDDYMEGSFEAVDVRREWSYIDILLLNERQRFVLLIENKIDTGERSGQLERYYEIVQREWPEYEILALYLTPGGDEPGDPRYHAVDYGAVCRVVEEVSANLPPGLDPGVHLLLTHYAQMLKRHIMSDTEVADLCRSIYAKHQRALDLIFEHKPSPGIGIGKFVERMIATDTALFKLYRVLKNYRSITFGLREWEESSLYRHDQEHGDETWLLFFNIENDEQGLRLCLVVAPGDQIRRARLFEVAQRHNFTGCPKRLTNWCRLSTIPILSISDHGKTQEEVETLISERWVAYICDELPRMAQAIREEPWLWEMP